jgi:uncharacterized protein with PQ loop repeat
LKKYTILKLLGVVLLTMISLVIISFAEVAIYSYLINPGHEVAVYDAHATASAPWISGIFGFIIFFLVVRYWGKKKYTNLLKLALGFVATYIVIDLIILFAFGVDWNKYWIVFLAANGVKLLGALAGYYSFRPNSAV